MPIDFANTLEQFRPTQKMLRLVAAVDEFKGAWRALRSIAPERLTALRRVATIESVGSSTRIEGVRLTNAEIEALLSGLETRPLRSRDEEEVAGYAALTLLVIGAFVVRFLAVHPFQDGNGRLSRALTTLLLLRAGYAYVPYSSLESVIEENKESYYLALRRMQASFAQASAEVVDWEPWLVFFLRALHAQTTRLQAKIEREGLIEGALPELSLRILEMARERGRLKSSEVVAVTGEARSTVRNRLNELVARRLLDRHGQGPATWYTLAHPG